MFVAWSGDVWSKAGQDYDDDDGGPCLDTYAWADTYLGFCITSPSQLGSLICGLLSIVCWMFAQLPQVFKTWREGSSESLSLFFLVIWLLGDVANLVGLLLAMDQHAITQLYLAVYFLLVEITMTFQYVYYNRKAGRFTRKGSYALFAVIPLAQVAVLLLTSPARSVAVDLHSSSRILLGLRVFNSSDSIIAYAIGWISGLLYFASRIPQILKNRKRRSTEGLALSMFVMAVLGNVTYVLSIFLKGHHEGFIISNLPWLLGSAGTFIFDFVIYAQFIMYKHNTAAETLNMSRSSAMSESEPLLIEQNTTPYREYKARKF